MFQSSKRKLKSSETNQPSKRQKRTPETSESPLGVDQVTATWPIENRFEDYNKRLKVPRTAAEDQLRKLHIATPLERSLINCSVVQRLSNSQIVRLARLEWKLPLEDSKLPTLLGDSLGQFNQWKKNMFYVPLEDADPKRFRSQTTIPFSIKLGDARGNQTSGEELRRWSILEVGEDQTALLNFMYRNLTTTKEDPSEFASRGQNPGNALTCVEEDVEARATVALRLKRFIDPEHRDVTHSNVDKPLFEEKRGSIADDLRHALHITLEPIDIKARVILLKRMFLAYKIETKGPHKNLPINLELVKLDAHGWSVDEMILLCKHNFPDVELTAKTVSFFPRSNYPIDSLALSYHDILADTSQVQTRLRA
jgi:hypothetical protein